MEGLILTKAKGTGDDESADMEKRQGVSYRALERGRTWRGDRGEEGGRCDDTPSPNSGGRAREAME